MEISNQVDLLMTDDGDIDIQSYPGIESLGNYYIKEVTELDLVVQMIKNRIKTTKPDWFFDEIGANLEEILGMENSRDTALYGAELIQNALTEGGYISSEDIYIKPVPADTFSILYFVAIHISDNETLQFKVNVALNAGVNIEEMM